MPCFESSQPCLCSALRSLTLTFTVIAQIVARKDWACLHAHTPVLTGMIDMTPVGNRCAATLSRCLTTRFVLGRQQVGGASGIPSLCRFTTSLGQLGPSSRAGWPSPSECSTQASAKLKERRRLVSGNVSGTASHRLFISLTTMIQRGRKQDALPAGASQSQSTADDRRTCETTIRMSTGLIGRV